MTPDHVSWRHQVKKSERKIVTPHLEAHQAKTLLEACQLKNTLDELQVNPSRGTFKARPR